MVPNRTDKESLQVSIIDYDKWRIKSDQMEWDFALRVKKLNVNPLGPYHLNRWIRHVGKAYKRLIQDWRTVLPTQSVCRRVPVVVPEMED